MKMTRLIMFVLGIFIFNACQPDESLNDSPLSNPLDNIETGDGGVFDINDIGTGSSSQDLIALGRALFWDPILSGGKDVSCATCHHPQFGYTDGRALSIGVDAIGLGPDRQHLSPEQYGFVRRNAPTILNTAFNGIDENGHYDPVTAPMFWDNREESLELQALGPIQSFEEMRGHAFGLEVALDSIVARIRKINQYRTLFARVFGNNNSITSGNIGLAIATFERTIVATNSPFDRYQQGDHDAMTPNQIRGMNEFARVGCNNCHNGPMFSDFQLHTLGVPDHDLLTTSDAGANGTYAFRTPTLRNLNETGPYFHNGVGGNLQQTITFYITARNFANNNPRGPGSLDVNPNVNQNDIDPEIRDLGNLNNRDVQDIIAFIQALNDPDFDRSIPESVPSGLSPGGQ